MNINIPDNVYKEIMDIAKKHDVNKIILFGSRAKGNNTERSDVDIAVYANNFSSFYWDIQEHINSLLSFDIVNAFDGVSAELADEINKYGVTIYEKT